MQPPSEADIVAATQSLEVRKNLKLAQAEALGNVRECLSRQPVTGHGDDCLLSQPYRLPGSNGSLENFIADYLGHLIAEHRLDIEVLEAQIAFNARALAAYRSNILLPSFGPRKPSN